MPSEMVNILTHVISKDEDNVWLQVRVEGKGAADEGEEEELDYEHAAGEGAGGEGGEEEEGLGGGHLPQFLVIHSVISASSQNMLQLIILHFLLLCPHL